METKHKANKQLSLAFFLNLLFAIVELIGGILTNSTAIIADAFHDFMDAVAIGIAVYMDKYSQKPASEKFAYGYRRFSLLSAIIMSAILLIGAVFMLYNGLTFINETKEVNSVGMFALAVLGIAVNGFAFLKIKKGDSHAHHHHNHAPDANSKAIMLHLLEDVLGWVAVLIGAVVMYFTNWFWIDNLLTIFIAFFISYNALKNLSSTFRILLQAVPPNIVVKEIKTSLENIPHVVTVEQLHIWSLDGNKTIASVIITISDLLYYNSTQLNVKQVFTNYKIQQLTLQINTLENIPK
ncbi:cation diffusion facilitator family transporter [Paenimyroides viscosum]|uniref:Cation transporter n=1 Tax=Paenimyroides viscosum TaxID=2488729 RepID=A0A3P1AQ50_9FLAO|nr:cation diffusion facilitator family transporter [Paenimyroides viscosum]RRA90810.1 cation transporter [Paenimyroides viscosum]